MDTRFTELKLTIEYCPQEKSEEQELIENCDSRILICCLYLVCSIKPEIDFAANFSSSIVKNPGEKDWKAGRSSLIPQNF